MVTRHDPRVEPGIVTSRGQVLRFTLGRTADLDEFTNGRNEGQSTVAKSPGLGPTGAEDRSDCYTNMELVSIVFESSRGCYCGCFIRISPDMMMVISGDGLMGDTR